MTINGLFLEHCLQIRINYTEPIPSALLLIHNVNEPDHCKNIRLWVAITRGENYYTQPAYDGQGVRVASYNPSNLRNKVITIENSLNKFFFNITIPYRAPYVAGSVPLTYKSTIPNATIPLPVPNMQDVDIPNSPTYINEGYNIFNLKYNFIIYNNIKYSVKSYFRNEITLVTSAIDLRIQTDQNLLITTGSKIYLALTDLLTAEVLTFITVTDQYYLNFTINRTKFPPLRVGNSGPGTVMGKQLYDEINSFYIY